MRRTLTAVTLSAILATGAIALTEAPAMAAAGGNCSTGGYVCLYQWEDEGAQDTGDRWQSSMSNIYNHANHCVSLLSPVAEWDNGTEVYHNSGSYQQSASSAFGNYFVYLWTNTDCTGYPGGHLVAINTATGYTIDDLHTVDAFHQVASVQLVKVG